MRFRRFLRSLAAPVLAVAALHAQTVVVTPSTSVLDAAGGTVTFTAAFSYDSTPSVLGLNIVLPTGWSYVSGSDEPSFVKPASGQQGALDWAYVTVPGTAPTFTFTATYPASTTTLQDFTVSSIGRSGTGAPPTTTVNPPLYIENASTLVTWNPNTTGDWGTAANWTPNLVPDNNSAEAYSVAMASGSANLTSSYAITNLQFTGGTISGVNKSLTLHGLNSTWLAGTFEELTTLIIERGARLTASGSAPHVFNDTYINNKGDFTWTGPGDLTSAGGNIYNEIGATFTDASDNGTTATQLRLESGYLPPTTAGAPADGFTLAAAAPSPNNGTFINLGTYQKTGLGETILTANAVSNSGSFLVNAGQLTIDSVYLQNSGKLYVASGATVRFNQAGSPVSFAGGMITGGGTLQTASEIFNQGTISPGSPILGSLGIQGDLTLGAFSNLYIDIDGNVQGVSYDHLSVIGVAALTGNLTLNLLDHARATLTALDTLTILSASSVTGNFALAVDTNGNPIPLTDGMRLNTLDNLASFRINYSSSAVTLTDFQLTVVPEPSTWALLIAGASALGVRALRRRRA